MLQVDAQESVLILIFFCYQAILVVIFKSSCGK